MESLDAETVRGVMLNIVHVLGLEADNVRSVFIDPKTVEVDFVEDPAEPVPVDMRKVAEMVRLVLMFLDLESNGLRAMYFSPACIKVRYADKEVTIEPQEANE